VDEELWTASGWTQPNQTFEASPLARSIADELSVPAYNFVSDKDVKVYLPKPPWTDSLVELMLSVAEPEREVLVQLLHAHRGNSDAFTSDPRLGQLQPELRGLVVDYVSAPEPHGPPYVVVSRTFPTMRYLERLFRTGALTAKGNVPGCSKAHELSRDDWGGLSIAIGGDAWRLGVWPIGKASATGGGVFENLRIEREQVLSVFPADVVTTGAVIGAVLETVELCSARPAENASNRKPMRRTKPAAAAEALKRLFPYGRPSLTVDELGRELKLKAPEVGTCSLRTLTRAISLAWPTAAPTQAK